MYVIEAESADKLLIATCQEVQSKGRKRAVRGFNCIEFTRPVCLVLHNPANRWITIAERKWGKYLPLVESMWLANGRNDLETVGFYLPRMQDFSDDGVYCRAAYGPRLRRYQGEIDQYQESEITSSKSSGNRSGNQSGTVDQIAYVVKCFQADPNTRQATINIGDPVKDSFETSQGRVLDTKLATVDYPCTRGLQFINNEGKLDLIVNMRSNDMIWGAFGVNIFNFTWMQEYIANILELKVGTYYHMAANLHYYDRDNMEDTVKAIANATPKDYPTWYYPQASFSGSLAKFDALVVKLATVEQQWRQGVPAVADQELLDDSMFRDWTAMIQRYHSQKSRLSELPKPATEGVERHPVYEVLYR